MAHWYMDAICWLINSRLILHPLHIVYFFLSFAYFFPFFFQVHQFFERCWIAKIQLNKQRSKTKKETKRFVRLTFADCQKTHATISTRFKISVMHLNSASCVLFGHKCFLLLLKLIWKLYRRDNDLFIIPVI